VSDISLTVQEGTPITLTLATAAEVTSSVTPKALGSAAIGTDSKAARADHVHPIGNVVALAIALG
jgi:hypothetical protein